MAEIHAVAVIVPYPQISAINIVISDCLAIGGHLAK